MLYVGGGAGMAPCALLYQLFRTLKTGRKVTFWYGEDQKKLFYLDHFRALEKDFLILNFM